MLTIADGSFTGGVVDEGEGAGGGAKGAEVGTDLFLMSGTTATFSPDAGKTLTFNGTISDDSLASLPTGQSYTAGNGAGAAVTLSGAGTVVFAGANTYSGATTISGATLLVTGSLLSSAVSVQGGSLGGTGTTGAVNVASGGTLSPGTSVGVLSTGSLTFAAGAHFKVEIGAQSDRVAVSGTVDLAGATLDVSLIAGFNPAEGTTFTIVDNDGVDSVIGTFAGRAEGTAST